MLELVRTVLMTDTKSTRFVDVVINGESWPLPYGTKIIPEKSCIGCKNQSIYSSGDNFYCCVCEICQYCGIGSSFPAMPCKRDHGVEMKESDRNEAREHEAMINQHFPESNDADDSADDSADDFDDDCQDLPEYRYDIEGSDSEVIKNTSSW